MINILTRLTTIMTINAVVLTSYLLGIVAIAFKCIMSFMIFRFLIGFVCGSFSVVTPIYLSEIAPKHMRGISSTFHQLAISIGVIGVTIFSLPDYYGKVEHWRYTFLTGLVPFLIHILFLPFCVETPKYAFFGRKNSINAEQSMQNKISII
jgi:MFS family permease